MIDVDKIEDALVAGINGAGLNLKTVSAYEADFDQAQPSQLLLMNPFVLVHYEGLEVDDEQRLHDYSVGRNGQEFTFTVGSQSLKDRRDGQKGCYTIIRGLRGLFDGKTLTADGKQIPIGLVRETFVDSRGGLIVYASTYRVFDL